jgi:hypothetical protein
VELEFAAGLPPGQDTAGLILWRDAAPQSYIDDVSTDRLKWNFQR